MDGSVLCGQCDEPLDESPNTPADKRKPCPRCGSKNRIHNAYGSDGVVIGQVIESSVALPVTRGPGDPGVLLQAVVVPGPQVPEGSLITAVAPAWNAIVAMLENDPSLAFTIDPRKWEEIIAAAYDESRLFDEVILTPRSGDLGRDVIAVKHGHFSVRFIDQVKAYGPGHRVTANDVRALFGVLSADPKANKGIVTTTSEFAPKIGTDPLLAPFIPHRLELVDGKQLITKLSDIAKGRTA